MAFTGSHCGTTVSLTLMYTNSPRSTSVYSTLIPTRLRGRCGLTVPVNTILARDEVVVNGPGFSNRQSL